MYLFAGLKEQLETYLEPDQVEQIQQAYVVARDAHSGQLRSSGDPYITHPVAVARILTEYHFDPQTNVIDVHISRLRSKIDKGYDTQLLHTVRGAGYCLREPD